VLVSWIFMLLQLALPDPFCTDSRAGPGGSLLAKA